MLPEDVVEALPVITSRCGELDRDPASLAISVHIWSEYMHDEGQARVDLLGGYREAGVDRVMGLVRSSARSDEALESLARDARAAGLKLA
jgi:hypothetical protein